jgi:hypothetical protein
MTTPKYLITPALDCSNLYKSKLSFWRWLGVGSAPGDNANVYISKDGITWTKVWANSTTVLESAWNQFTYDISAVADSSPTVYIRWGMGPTNSSVSYPGWNIDDVEITAQQFRSVADVTDLKVLRDGTPVRLDDGLIISAKYNSYFYAQQADGYRGIRVWWLLPVTEGAPVSVRGTLTTMTGQRLILATAVTQGTPGELVRPVGISLSWLGGSDLGIPPLGQAGVTGGAGLNNIGTFVKVWGRVTQIGSNYFYIDDGSGLRDGTKTGTVYNEGVRVLLSGAGVTSGQFVTVTGVSSCFWDGTNYHRQIVPRNAADIR